MTDNVKQLLKKSRSIYGNKTLRHRWVRAKLALGERKPAVDIGIERVDTSRFPRTAKEAGILDATLGESLELPPFFRRFIGDNRRSP